MNRKEIPLIDFPLQGNGRRYAFIGVKEILDYLKKIGIDIGRNTFYNLEKSGLFISRRTPSGWRRYNRSEASIIIHLICTEYGTLYDPTTVEEQ